MIGKGNDCLFPLYIKVPDSEFVNREHPNVFLRVPCGHCINCKIRRSMEWSIRLVCESLYWKESCFITLTYDEENLPKNYIDPHFYFTDEEIEANPDLNYLYTCTHCPDHLRNFIKRLRKRLDHKIRFFAVAEYGSRRGRSHLHVLVFGLPYVERKTEAFIQKLWHYGHVNVRPFFQETCCYVAGYVQKKLYGNKEYLFKLPEFMRCSQHLGEQWLRDHMDYFDDDHPYFIFGKYKYAIPRQFRRILVQEGRLSSCRMLTACENQLSDYADLRKHLANTGISESDFFRGRISDAIEKEKRKNNRRDKTGDI